MRTIRKGAEPNSLAQHRHTDGADYQNYRDKDALRTFLVREQRGLCCYCMARVRADRDAMKIEHWHSQSGHPQEQLDYTNLLASCMGNDGRYNAERYCDSSKGERELSRNPANPLHAVESLTHFLGNRVVESRL